MIRAFIRFVLRLLWRVRVKGDTQQLLRGRPLVVANHDSYLDGVLLGLFLPGAPTVVVTRADLRPRLARWLMAVVSFAILEPARPLAIKRLIREVRDGRAVAIFPQGRVTTTGGVMKVYDSAGLIASRCDADIIPVRIEGTLHTRFAAVEGGFPRRWLPGVTLTVMPAVKLPGVSGSTVRERRRRLADAVLGIMQRMMFDSRPRRTLFEALVDAAELYGRGTRIIEDAREQPESYGDLLKTSLALGRLAGRISREGETVGVLMPNISTTVCLVFGLTAMRRTPAMLNYTAGAEAMRGACVAAGVGTVITSRRFIELARLGDAVKALSSGLRFIYLEDLRAQFTAADKLWLIARALPRPRAAVPRQDAGKTGAVHLGFGRIVPRAWRFRTMRCSPT
ncbi:MAG: 1-acyl-sn-glycerol-3-phosphate acyltransferase [Burkholderiales bacterium]|nr:1-acyl-sn-glycerol-3-phosphate acyltransferase [Burkholderiales bacterium]